MSKKDFYDILGTNKSSSPEEIKKAYRQNAIKYHPDKNPGDKAAEDKFKEAAEAYEVLSDPDKRQRYDQFGHAGVDQVLKAAITLEGFRWTIFFRSSEIFLEVEVLVDNEEAEDELHVDLIFGCK